MTIKYDYSRLRGLIREFCGTNENFAKAIGISDTSLYERLRCDVPFNQVEIHKACQLFKCSVAEADDIFFRVM